VRLPRPFKIRRLGHFGYNCADLAGMLDFYTAGLGLIVSDDLEMGGVLAAGTIEEVAVETVRAGADIFLVCHNLELVWRAYEAVLREAEKDRRFLSRVADAVVRITKFKRRATELQDPPPEPTSKVVKALQKTTQDFIRTIEQREEWQEHKA